MSKIWTPEQQVQPPPGMLKTGVNGEQVVMIIEYPGASLSQVTLTIENAKEFSHTFKAHVEQAERNRMEARMQAAINGAIEPGELGTKV